MKKYRDPAIEKQRDYDNQHISDAEYPHAWRHQRARRKASLHRSRRRKTSMLLTETAQTGTLEAPTAEQRATRHCNRVNIRSRSLRESLARRMTRRVRTIGHNHTKKTYNAARDQEAFVAMLESIVAGRSKVVAAEMRDRLVDQTPWMQAFFADCPEWGSRLMGWVDDVSGECRC